MQTTVEKQKTGEAILTITLTPDEMRPYLDRASRELSSQTKIPGFRPGTVPYDVLKRHLGEGTIHDHAAETAIRMSFVDAIQEQDLTTVAQPTIDVLKNAPGNEFTYRATVALLPDVRLKTYIGLTAKREDTGVKSEQVESVLDELRRSRAKQTATDRPAAQGDRASISFTTYLDKVPVEGGQMTKQEVEIGRTTLIPGFEEQIVGLKRGEKKSFTLTMPKDHPAKHLAGRTVEFALTMDDVFAVELPALDDAFAASLGSFTTLAELRTQLEQNLRIELTEDQDSRFETALYDEIAKHATFGPFPPQLIDAELDKMLAELKHDAGHRSIPYDAYLRSLGKTEEELRTDLRPGAERRIRAALITRTIADQEQIVPTEQEIEAAVSEQLARVYDPKLLEQAKSPEYREYLETVLTARKVAAYLVEHSKAGPRPTIVTP